MNPAVRIQNRIAFFSLLLFAGKLWAWYLTNSVSILTDALESTVNVITGFIGLYSVKLAAKPRDANHPYGHGKAEFVSAAVEGALILIAGLVIIAEVVYIYLNPQPLKKIDTGLVITTITGVANLLFGTYALRFGRRSHSMTVEAAGTHLRSDAWSTFAVAAGLLVVHFTGLEWIDRAIALVFGVVIVVTGYKLLRRSLGGIMDEADEQLLEDVLQIINANRSPAWLDLHNFRGIQYGEVLHIDAHLVLPYYFTVEQASGQVNFLENLIRQRFGGKVECFVHIDAGRPGTCAQCGDECVDRTHLPTATEQWRLADVMADKQHPTALQPNP